MVSDDDWQEEHARLAQLDEGVRDLLAEGDVSSASLPPPAGSVPHPSSLPRPSASTLPPPGLEERGGGDLAESLTRLLLGSDPAIAGVGAAESDRSCFPSMSHAQGLSASLQASLLSYQQHQHILHRGPPPLPQVNVAMVWNLAFMFWNYMDMYVFMYGYDRVHSVAVSKSHKCKAYLLKKFV